MSFDLSINVKVEGCDKYVSIATPEYDSPTYNLGKMFRACMGWDYESSSLGEDGRYHKNQYPCDIAIEKVEKGIRELRTHPLDYLQYVPANGWGTMEDAIKTLESLRRCIYEKAENIPINCLYMSW